MPNRHGGRENLEAIEFLREMNTIVHAEYPGVLTIAEESTAFPGVSHPVYAGGLGFTHKWNMGWMHDTLAYLEREPVHRRFHHHELTFGLGVRVDRALRAAALPRRGRAPQGLAAREDAGRRLAALRHAAGARTGGCGATRARSCCSWARSSRSATSGATTARSTGTCSTQPSHAGVRDLLRELNRLEAALPALWRLDHSTRWLRAGSRRTTPSTRCYAFVRSVRTATRRSSWPPTSRLCPATATGSACRPAAVAGRAQHRRRPLVGERRRPIGEGGVAEADDGVPWHGQPASMRLTLPPLSVVWLAPD